jgi:hypothetical protein
MQQKQIFSLTSKILLTILISFVLLELLLLVFNDLVFRNSFYVYDPDLGFKVRPYVQWGDNVTNEFGFNDRDYPHQKEPGVYRILFLSDSFSWAGGLNDNYTAILEEKFEAEFGDRRIEVINAGYPGTHTGEQLQLLRKFGLQYNPDLVVLGIFVGNDFLDADPWRKRIVVGGTTTDIDTRQDREITFLGQLLVPQSRLYLFLKEQWNTFRYTQAQQQTEVLEFSPATPQVQPAIVTKYSDQHLSTEFARMQVANWANAAAFQSHEEYIFDKLLAMRDLLAEKNIDFIVVAYPDEFQVDENLRQAVFDRYQEDDAASYQWDRPQGLLWQFCVENNIEFYDMLPTFQEAQRSGERLYIPNDPHWNEAGNALAGKYLFEMLVWKAREYFNQ